MEVLSAKVGQRIRQIMEKVCQGNQRKLGQLLGIAPPIISRTVNDQRLPSFEFLKALAHKTPVDLRWLLTGEGTAFGEKEKKVDTLPEEHSLRLSKRLLDHPSEHISALPRFSFPELDGLYRKSRYIVEVQHHDPAVRVKAAKIKAGDLLVLETDPVYWESDPVQLAHRDCVVSITSGHTTTLSLGHIATEIIPGDVPDKINVNVYGGETVVVQISDDDARSKEYRKYLRSIVFDENTVPDIVHLNALVLFVWRSS